MFYVEKYGPITLSTLVAFSIYYWRREISAASISNEMNIPVLYSSIFDWASIQTGFLFGIFGYIGGKTDGFIGAVKNTDAMRQFAAYMRSAIWIGFVLTISSVPLMVTQFSIGGEGEWRMAIFIAWAFLSVLAFLSFLRVAYIFGLLLRPSHNVE